MWAVQEYSVTVYPCMPSIASITSPSIFTGVSYYQNITDGFINIEIFADGTIDPNDEVASLFTIIIPVFVNNDDILCPLIYRISSTSDSYTEDTILN